MKYYLGIDVGGTKVAYGLFDETKQLVARHKHPTDKTLASAPFFNTICDEAQGLLDRRRVRKEDVAGIGMGMASFLDFYKGTIIRTGAIPQIRDFPVRSHLEKRWGLDIPIVVDNDGNAGALAEFHHGAGKYSRNMLFCSVGTGIGSRMIVNGALFRGDNGWAGESGHMLAHPFDEQEVVCGCNNAGCFFSYCSGMMLPRRVKAWIEAGEKTLLTDMLDGDLDQLSCEHIGAAAARGDALALRAVDFMAEYMALWLYNTYILLNINLIVFSGGLVGMGDRLFGEVRRRFDAYCQVNSKYVEFTFAELGEDTGIIGAMELLMDASARP